MQKGNKSQEEINADIYERLEKLERALHGTKSMGGATSTPRSKFDFSRNERYFVKLHAKGMNGEKKFVLLVAYLAKGKTDVDIKPKDVETKWNKMTESNLMGSPYNGKYATMAKNNGWVDSRKYGTYHLTDSWREIFD